MREKIQPSHLERDAVVYLRQSSENQVRNNWGSTQLQYALVERAKALGWDQNQIHVIDCDLGRSGKSSHNRLGFSQLKDLIPSGKVSAILAFEVSRFCRNRRDWDEVLDLCFQFNVLVIDQDSIYDLRNPNDRLMLGIKGSMSEFELSLLQSRMHQAAVLKASKGELRLSVPTGYVRSGQTGSLEFDREDNVHEVMVLIFKLYRELGTAGRVLRYFIRHKLQVPVRKQKNGATLLNWVDLKRSRLLSILKNPTYAGVYAYRDKQSDKVVEVGQVSQAKGQQKPRGNWHAWIPDAHPAYITLEEYWENQERLAQNCPLKKRGGCQGSPKEGHALLQGWVICGKCGRRMTNSYTGEGSKNVTYICERLKLSTGSPNICWSVSGNTIDSAVATHLLGMINLEQLNLSLAVLDEMKRDFQGHCRQWELALQQAKKSAALAEKRYLSVDPGNRKVASRLEQDWNDKLNQFEALKNEFAELQKQHQFSFSKQQQQQILRLVQDYPTVWNASTTTPRDRKEILRLLVKQVKLTPIDEPQRQTKITILWHTGAISELSVIRSGRGRSRRTPEPVLQLIQQLASTTTDAEIAQELNRRGFRDSERQEFNKNSVCLIRYRYQILSGWRSHREA